MLTKTRALAGLFLSLLLAIPAFAQSTTPDSPPGTTLATDGAGEVTVPADGATVRFGVQGRGDSAADASATAARRLQNLLDGLAALGDAIEKPVSSGYNVSPDYRWDDDGEERRLVGYTASSSLTVEVRDLEALGGVIDAALAADADDVGNPRFTSTREREARDRALELAYEQAARDAAVLARAAGGALGSLAELTTNPSVFRGGEMLEAITVTGKAPGVAIENPEVTVRVTVAGKWYLAPAG